MTEWLMIHQIYFHTCNDNDKHRELDYVFIVHFELWKAYCLRDELPQGSVSVTSLTDHV